MLKSQFKSPVARIALVIILGLILIPLLAIAAHAQTWRELQAKRSAEIVRELLALPPEGRAIVEEAAKIYYGHIKSVRPNGSQLQLNDPETGPIIDVGVVCTHEVIRKVRDHQLISAQAAADAKCSCVNAALTRRKDLNGIVLLCLWQAQLHEDRSFFWLNH